MKTVITTLFLVLFVSATYAVPKTACRVTKTTDSNDGSCDAGDCSLREAIANTACPTVDFSFDLVGQRIYLLSDIVIDRTVSIKGYGADAITIAAGNMTRLFYIAPGGNATISGVTMTDGKGNGTGPSGGGAIRNAGGQLTLDGVYLTGNVSQGGGALAGNATIRNSTISRNWSGPDMDGAILSGFTLNLYNVTITDNTGAGIFTQGFPEVVNSTIANNSGPGLAMDSAAIFMASNSIVRDIYQFDQWSSVISFGNNIFSNAPGTMRPVIASSTDLVGVDPMLGPFSYYGGHVPTLPLLAGSPSIDRGDNQLAINAGLTADQRGYQRFVDGDGNGTATVDIGAYEFNAAPVSTVSVSGRVLGAVSGNPLRSVTVVLTELDGTRHTTLSSSLGWYNFQGLPSGFVYTVVVAARRGSIQKTVFADQNVTDGDILVPGL